MIRNYLFLIAAHGHGEAIFLQKSLEQLQWTLPEAHKIHFTPIILTPNEMMDIAFLNTNNFQKAISSSICQKRKELEEYIKERIPIVFIAFLDANEKGEDKDFLKTLQTSESFSNQIVDIFEESFTEVLDENYPVYAKFLFSNVGIENALSEISKSDITKEKEKKHIYRFVKNYSLESYSSLELKQSNLNELYNFVIESISSE
ncbi:MAG: hypothetical protein ACRCUP_04985 [Mycoplasmatales bacterium]